MNSRRPAVLFLCTGNSCRSQMAEGWARYMHGHTIDAYSAGTAPQNVNPRAIHAMAEVGVDISSQESKHLNDLSHLHFDLVITVCDNAASSCPMPPHGSRVVHVPFDDPPQLAKDSSTEEDALKHFRRVRDEIKAFVANLPSICKETYPLCVPDEDQVLGRVNR